jgi:hypothetical protein
MANDPHWKDELSIEDYSHHNEDAERMWAAEQSEYDGEPSSDPYGDDDWW